MPKPWIYHGHLHFIDFQKANYSDNPVYINIIRDPVDRLASFYYYRRRQDLWYAKPLADIFSSESKKEKEVRRTMSFNDCVLKKQTECADFRFNFQVMPHFCGQDDYCIYPSKRALEQAKENAEKHFAVIGYLEKYVEFVEMLEHILPNFFRGAMSTYDYIIKMAGGVIHKNKQRKEVISEGARNLLLQRLDIQLEYEFFNFVKERFDLQYKKFLYCSVSLNNQYRYKF